MKKIITSVGTSIFTNYFDEGKNSNIDKTKIQHYEELIEHPLSDWEKNRERIDLLKSSIEKWAIGNNNIKSSAEIESIVKIIDKYENEEFTVYLLVSDTILSKLSSDIIKKFFQNHKRIHVEEPMVIKGFQVLDQSKFINKGLINLMGTIKTILYNKKSRKMDSNAILNISGGYKIGIPFFTLIGQVYKIETVYLYENSNTLIRVPNLPISFDELLAEKIYFSLENPNSIHSEEKRLLKRYGLIENKKVKRKFKQYNITTLTPLGELYKNFIEEEYPLSKKVLGYYMEYKIYEYFLGNHYKSSDNVIYDKILHSEQFYGNEIDLIFKTTSNNNFILAEIKSSFQISNLKRNKNGKSETRIEHVTNQIIMRVKSLPNNELKNLKEYHLYTYSINRKGNVKNYSTLLAPIKESLNQYNVKFKCFYIKIDINRIRNQSAYPSDGEWKSFMQYKLSKTDFNEINLSKQ